MEIPLDIRLDPAQLSSGADEVEGRADQIGARRAEVDSAVESLLASWHGQAAARFAHLWERWAAGADEVVTALASSAAALRHARDQLVSADRDRAEEHAHLQGRLG